VGKRRGKEEGPDLEKWTPANKKELEKVKDRLSKK